MCQKVYREIEFCLGRIPSYLYKFSSVGREFILEHMQNRFKSDFDALEGG